MSLLKAPTTLVGGYKKKVALVWALGTVKLCEGSLTALPGTRPTKISSFCLPGPGRGGAEHWAGKIAENTLFSVRTIA